MSNIRAGTTAMNLLAQGHTVSLLRVWELVLSRHLDYFWESVRDMHFLPTPSKTFKIYCNVYEHCELFISGSPSLILNHCHCCICHLFHIRKRLPHFHPRPVVICISESRFAVLRGMQAKPALCYQDHCLSKSYMQLKQFEIQQIHSVKI